MHGYEHEEREARTKLVRYCASFPPFDTRVEPMMRMYLRERRLAYDLAVSNGWYPSSRAGDTEPRVVIPATTSDPENRYWQARHLDPAVTGNLRWQSPAASRGDAIILVYPDRIDRLRSVAVVEGPMDALAAAETGLAGVALMGLTPPDIALDLLCVMAAARHYGVTLVVDRDQPAGMVEILNRLISRGVYGKIVDPYPFKDLAAAPPATRVAILDRG